MKAGVALACACLAVALLAAQAKAADGDRGDRQPLEIQPPTTVAAAFVEGSHDYLLALEVPHPRVAILSALRLDMDINRSLQVAQAAYAVRTRPTVRNGVIKARFGDIASASLRFVPSGRRRVSRSQQIGCEGRRRVTQHGHFRGRIEIRGENDYTRASARRVSGALEKTFRLRCEPGFAEQPDPLLPSYLLGGGIFFETYDARLEAISEAGGRTVGLAAEHGEGDGPGATVEANASEWKDGMLTFRSVVVEGGAGTLLTSLPGARPAKATLKPPRPFRGEATFLELSPTSHSWTGSLAVHLPGLDVPLTGPDFATGLCVATLLKNPNGCSPYSPEPVVPERLMRLIGPSR